MSDWLNAGKNKDKDNKEGTTVTKNSKEGEQDRGGGRRRGAPLSPRIHQEHKRVRQDLATKQQSTFIKVMAASKLQNHSLSCF